MTALDVLYRGYLSSCTYDCSYCPFAKQVDPPAAIARDRLALANFASFIAAQEDLELRLLFTPWGEALNRIYYRETLTRLSHLSQVRRLSIQTNGAWSQDWLQAVDKDSFALWVTLHPDQTSYNDFCGRMQALRAKGIRHSIGIVALREHLGVAERLRADLPDDQVIWLNAYKDGGPDYYTDADLQRAVAIDPTFPINNTYHASRGRRCGAGQRAIAVDGDGVIRRCHFVREPIGSINDADWRVCLQQRPCPNERCGCYIGYMHLEELALDQIYGDGLLERIPEAGFHVG